MLLWFLYTTFRPPYRNMSTFIVQQVEWDLILDCAFYPWNQCLLCVLSSH